MTNLDYYLDYDHSARNRTMLLSVVVGAAIGMVSEWLDAPLKIAVALCLLTIGAIEILRAWQYAQPAEKKRGTVDQSPTRRSLLLVPLTAVLFIVLAFFPTSHVEAAVVERKLKRSAADPSDPENIQEVKRVLAQAEAAKIFTHRLSIFCFPYHQVSHLQCTTMGMYE